MEEPLDRRAKREGSAAQLRLDTDSICCDEQDHLESQDTVCPAAVMRKVDRHLIPWFFALGIACYLDRTNLSFAALQLNEDLGLTCATYGLGAGIFFAGYALFQVPSNLALVRLGAPLWLGAIIVAWSGIAIAFAFTSGTGMFLLLRFALGVAECGAFPGMWYHLSRFYTESELGPAYSKVASCTVLAQVVGAPLAAGILAMDGAGGLRGWQWLFILEGVPTLALGIALGLCLAPSPAQARCLAPAERLWLQRRLDAAERRSPGKGASAGAAHGGGSSSSSSHAAAVLRVMTDWRVLYLGVAWLLIAATMYGIIFWSPLLINFMFNEEGAPAGHAGHHSSCSAEHSGSGQAPPRHSSAVIALLTLVPFAVAAAGMVVVARMAARANERHYHAGIPILLGAFFLGLVPLLMDYVGAVAAFVSLVLAAAGVWSFHGPFMSWPAVFLHGPEVAAGFALINSLGAVGGFLGPYMLGLLAGGDGGYEAAMRLLALLLALSGGLILVFPAPGKLEEPRVTIMGPEDLGDSTTSGSYPSKSGAPAEELQPLAGNLGRSRGSSRGNHVLEMSKEGELAAEVRPLGARCVSSGEDGGKGDAPAPALPLSRTGGAGAESLAQQTLELERRPIPADMDRHQYGASLVSLTSGVAVPPAVQQSLDLERRLHWDHSHRFSL
ncbi:hypothetical protein N2152v2_000349 [Parachlorella kessleri]